MRQTVNARLINGLWIMVFLVYKVRIKPERKCVGFRFMLGLFLVWLIPLLSDYTSIVSLVNCLVLFYNYFHYQIRFNDFNMKFVSDSL